MELVRKIKLCAIRQTSLVQRLDDAIYWINRYPVVKFLPNIHAILSALHETLLIYMKILDFLIALG